jgi:photosystem II stability/assembly factor-like uncharacterized protein
MKLKYLVIFIIINLFCIKCYSDDFSKWKFIYNIRDAYKNAKGIDSLIQYFFVHSVHSVDSLNFIITSSKNQIIKSTDGGETWKVILNTGNNSNWGNLKHCCFPSKNFIFCTYGGSLTLRTLNGGITWDSINIGIDAFIWGINFNKNGYGLCTFTNKTLKKIQIIRSSDFGSTWSVIDNIPDFLAYYSPQIIEDSIYICRALNTSFSNVYLLRSDDTCRSWKQYTIISQENSPDSIMQHLIYDMKFSDSKNGWIVFVKDTNHNPLLKPYIFKTSDGGASWVKQFESYPNYVDFVELAIRDSLRVLSIIRGSYFLRTSNGGVNWIVDTTFFVVDSLGEDVYTKASYISDKRILVCDAFGYVYLWDEDGFPVNNVQEPLENKKEFIIYPNPVSNLCNINLNISKPLNLKIDFLNTFGQIILPSINEFADVGIYSKNLNLSDIAPGIYFVVINTGKERYVQKFVKIE